MNAPRCERPILVGRRDSRMLVPCGTCYACRRRLVRTRQGQAILEQKYPVYAEHRHPDCQHFLTLTYRDCPMTRPRPHKLGQVQRADGKVVPFNGPFTEPGRFRIIDGRPWSILGRRFLRDEELVEEHREMFVNRYGWSDSQVRQWENGSYEPVETVSLADVQRYVKRLRMAAQRAMPGNRLRVMYALEYGGVTLRPHVHIMIWGLPLQWIELAYSAWEGTPGAGHVDPDLFGAVVGLQTVLGDRAATYAAKDLSKDPREFRESPEVYARERPKVRGSLKPAIGAGGYLPWLRDWILGTVIPAADSADLLPGVTDRDIQRILYVRRNFSRVNVVHEKLRTDSFPTPITWQRRCVEDMAVTDDQWKETNDYFAQCRAIMTDLLMRPSKDGGLADEFKEHQGEYRRRSAAAGERETRRREAKRKQLVSQNRIRSDGGASRQGVDGD